MFRDDVKPWRMFKRLENSLHSPFVKFLGKVNCQEEGGGLEDSDQKSATEASCAPESLKIRGEIVGTNPSVFPEESILTITNFKFNCGNEKWKNR